MNRLNRWSVWSLVFSIFVVGVSNAQQRPANVGHGDGTPDLATLQRLAQQLGAGQSGSSQGKLSPEMMEKVKQLLQNKDFVNSPQFQQMLAEQKAKLQQDPSLAQQYKNSFTSDQLKDLSKLMPSEMKGGNGGSGSMPQLPTGPQGRVPMLPQPGTPIPQPPIQPGGNPENPNGPGGSGQQIPNGPGGQPGKPQTTNPFLPGGQSQNPGNPFQNNPSSLDPAKQLAEKNKGFAQVAGMWEQNVGSLDKTPALKQSLMDMFSGNGQGGNGFGNGQFGNGLNGLTGKSGPNGGKSMFDSNGNPKSPSGFGNWLKNMSNSGGPNWWKNMKSSNWGGGSSWFQGGGSNFTPPSPSGMGGGGFGSVGSIGGSAAGLGTFGVVVIGLIALAVIAFIVWRYWPQIQAMKNTPKPIEGFGPWPLDPRDVKDRETLVKAFEYLSVAICGDGARVWNHVTIAEAFRENVPGAAPFADPLARLYAIARYTPAREEISPADIAEARRYLCRLAGVSEA